MSPVNANRCSRVPAEDVVEEACNKGEYICSLRMRFHPSDANVMPPRAVLQILQVGLEVHFVLMDPKEVLLQRGDFRASRVMSVFKRDYPVSQVSNLLSDVLDLRRQVLFDCL